MKSVIGVLALQGGFAKHMEVLEKLGATTIEIRTEADLVKCDALIIPGGESTVLTKLLMKSEWNPGDCAKPDALYNAIRDFARTKPVMGTCAGLIMLAKPSADDRVIPFDLLPVTIVRNAYGRQAESFTEDITLSTDPSRPYPAIFIRAPRIESIGQGVSILAQASGHGKMEPVMIQYGKILALSFHPELTPEDTRIHEYFISLIG